MILRLSTSVPAQVRQSHRHAYRVTEKADGRILVKSYHTRTVYDSFGNCLRGPDTAEARRACEAARLGGIGGR